MNIYTTTIALSVVIYFAIGSYAGRRVRRLDDYYVAGRRAPTLVIVGTLVASLMSSTIFLGDAGFTYSGQAGPFILFPQAMTTGYVFGAIFFGRYLRRSRAATVAEFFGRRFNSSRVQAAAGATVILAVGGYLLAVTQGAAILFSQLTGLSYLQGLVVAWLSYTVFTMYSGSRGVILTDTSMFLVFACASVAAMVYLVDHFGGVTAAIEGLVAIEGKTGLMSWHGSVGPDKLWATPTDFLIWMLTINVMWLVVFAVSPWQASRHLMAKNEHVVLRGACLACLAVGLLQVMVYGMGAIINLAKADIVPAESVTIWAALNLLPPFLGALILAGIVAAALSSASTFLSLVGFSASNDIGIIKGTDESKALRLTRLIMLASGALVLIIASLVPADIYWLTTFIATVFASSWGPVGFMSIWSRRITEAAAFWGMLTGFVFNVVPKFFDFIGMIELPTYLNPVLIGGVASLVVTIAVSRRTEATAEEIAYLVELHEIPAHDVDAKQARFSLIAPACLIANGLVMPFLLIAYYVRPFQSASGFLAPDGSLDWFTGEAVLALSWALVYVSLGMFAIKVIRNTYSPVSRLRARPADS